MSLSIALSIMLLATTSQQYYSPAEPDVRTVDLQMFPDRDTCYINWQEARSRVAWLEQHIAGGLESGDWLTAYRSHLDYMKWCVTVWGHADDAWLCSRRGNGPRATAECHEHLRELRRLIGHHNYYRGILPQLPSN